MLPQRAKLGDDGKEGPGYALKTEFIVMYFLLLVIAGSVLIYSTHEASEELRTKTKAFEELKVKLGIQHDVLRGESNKFKARSKHFADAAKTHTLDVARLHRMEKEQGAIQY
jgi:hypothetical protein